MTVRAKMQRPNAGASRRSEDVRWAAVVARDKRADGQFYYSVATTGIYCRPSCPSRAAKRANVSFHETADAAEAAGYRPCKRCNPRSPSLDIEHTRRIVAACRLIEAAGEPPALKELAADAGMSPFHFHRIFKAVTGLTPKGYAEAHRHKRVKENLSNTGSTVTEALGEAGFNSSSRFYASSSKMLGMEPTVYKSGGSNVDLMFSVGECWLGSILVAATQNGIAAVLMGDDARALLRDLQDRFPKANLLGGDKAFDKLAAQVLAVVDGSHVSAKLPLDIQGTLFQHKVWSALKSIPAGTTVNYAEIAKQIGDPKAVRAVATACGANPVAVLIPCHRVVRSDGALSGYRWGIVRKRALLDREASVTTGVAQTSNKDGRRG